MRRGQAQAIERRAAVLAAIIACPDGIQRSKVMEQTGVGKTAFCWITNELRERGLVVNVGTGPATVWGPPSLQWAPQKPRSAAYLRQRAVHAKTRRLEAAERRALEGVDDPLPIVRIFVPAAEAKPLPKVGVASIWELAA
jgi:hypothetical protein